MGGMAMPGRLGTIVDGVDCGCPDRNVAQRPAASFPRDVGAVMMVAMMLPSLGAHAVALTARAMGRDRRGTRLGRLTRGWWVRG